MLHIHKYQTVEKTHVHADKAMLNSIVDEYKGRRIPIEVYEHMLALAWGWDNIVLECIRCGKRKVKTVNGGRL